MKVLQMEDQETENGRKLHQFLIFLILTMKPLLLCVNCGGPVRRNLTHLKTGMLPFHFEIQVGTLMTLLAGGSLKEHFDSLS